MFKMSVRIIYFHYCMSVSYTSGFFTLPWHTGSHNRPSLLIANTHDVEAGYYLVGKCQQNFASYFSNKQHGFSPTVTKPTSVRLKGFVLFYGPDPSNEKRRDQLNLFCWTEQCTVVFFITKDAKMSCQLNSNHFPYHTRY